MVLQEAAYSRQTAPDDVLAETSKFVSTLDGLAPQFTGAIQAYMWLHAVEAFRSREADFLVDGKYESELEAHRATLSRLLNEGEELVCFLKQFGLPKGLAEFKQQDVEATLESLHVTFNCQHRSQSTPALSAAVEKFLNVAE